MWFVGVQTCATFCRPPFIQTCWNTRHKWYCRHILGPKIKMRHTTVPNYMPARGQDIGLSRNTFSKKDCHMDIVLLHLELSLIFSRHIRHGRVLTNIGLRSRIHEIQIGVSRKAGCPCRRLVPRFQKGSRSWVRWVQGLGPWWILDLARPFCRGTLETQDLKIVLCRKTLETQDLKILICSETLKTQNLKILIVARPWKPRTLNLDMWRNPRNPGPRNSKFWCLET